MAWESLVFSDLLGRVADLGAMLWNMRNRIRQIWELSPAFCAFAGIFCGTMGRDHGWSVPVLILMIAFWGMLLRWSGASWWRTMILSLFLPLGWLRCAWTGNACGQSYLRLLSRPAAGVKFRVVLTQTPMGTGRLAPWDAGRGVVLADFRAMETVSSEGMKVVSGCVVLHPMSLQDKELLRTCPLGGVLEGKGRLLPVPPPDDPVSGFYGEYLLAHGVFRELELEEFHAAGEESGGIWRWRKGVRRTREWLGERLTRGCKDVADAQLLLALGLGLGEFVPTEMRQRQVDAGTVHVFAISGMHVGMVALLFMLLLRWSGLSLQWQWGLTAVLDALYVILTGGGASGLRALLMALLVLYAHFRWRAPVWLNTLGLAGSAALLVNSFCIKNLGFVYSYVIVAILLMLAPMTRRVGAILAEKHAWLPRELRPRRRTAMMTWLCNGLLVSFFAWLGSTGISLQINHQLNLVAPLVNLPLGIMVYVTLLLCPLRVLLGVCLPFADGLWSGVLAASMRATSFLASCSAEGHASLPVAQIHYWQSVLFYLLLALLLLVLSDGANGAEEEFSRKNSFPQKIL